jgi:hypothetical protein
MCVRALDYCPPLDLTFGEFLRAVITADRDHDPEDPEGVRDAWMQAFRLRGILPDGAHFFSEDALCWPLAIGFPPVDGLEFGDPNGLTRQQKGSIAAVLRKYANRPDVRKLLGFDPEAPVFLPSFHPAFRLRDGALRTDMVVEVMQREERPLDGDMAVGKFPFHGGATLIITPTDAGAEAPPVVRYAITKQFRGHEAESRVRRQRAYLQQLGCAEGNATNRFRIDFSLVHGGI